MAQGVKKRKKKGRAPQRKAGPTPRRREEGIRFAGVHQTFGGQYNLPRLQAQLKWDDDVVGEISATVALAESGEQRLVTNMLWRDLQEGAEEAHQRKTSVMGEMKSALERIALADAEGAAGELALATLEKCGLVKPKPVEQIEEAE